MGNSNFISLPQLITKTINNYGKNERRIYANENMQRYYGKTPSNRTRRMWVRQSLKAMHDIAQQPSINQLNNKKMSKKTMQEKLRKQPEPIVETRKEALRRMYKENGLVEEDIYKDKRGFVVITRTGIDKIVSRNNITVAYEVINMDIEKGICVLRAAASMKVGNEVKNAMSFGEASNNNLMGGGKKFPVAMAEKRAMSRVVLKISGFYEQGVFGQDEIVD